MATPRTWKYPGLNVPAKSRDEFVRQGSLVLMQKTAIALVVMAALLLGACGSIPLGTMWKMYRMGPEGLLSSNATEVRAAVLSEKWFLDDENFDAGRLEVKMTRADESVEPFAFVLEEVSEREQFQLEPAGPGQRWRVYAIEGDDLAAFQAMQRQLSEWLESDEFKGGSMSVSVKFDDATIENPSGTTEETDSGDVAADAEPRHSTPGHHSDDDSDSHPDEVQFRIDLRLREDEGYFTLIRQYAMPITSADDED